MEYTIKLSEQDFPALSAALGELPYRVAAPLVEKINRQIAEQQNAEKDRPVPSGASPDNL